MSSNVQRDIAPIGRGPLLALAIAVEGGLLLLAVGLMYLADVRPTLGVSGTTVGVGIAAGGLMAGTAAALTSWGAGPLGGLREDFETVLVVLGNARVPDIIVLSALAGLGEEALFRGFLQPWIGGWAGPALGVVAAAVLFGAAHAISRPYAVYAGIVGLMLGALTVLTDSLAAAIVAHAVYDLVLLWWGTRLFRPGRRAPGTAGLHEFPSNHPR